MSKQPPPAPTARAVGPCPTQLQISRTPRYWNLTQHHRTTRPPEGNTNKFHYSSIYSIKPTAVTCLSLKVRYGRYNFEDALKTPGRCFAVLPSLLKRMFFVGDSSCSTIIYVYPFYVCTRSLKHNVFHMWCGKVIKSTAFNLIVIYCDCISIID